MRIQHILITLSPVFLAGILTAAIVPTFAQHSSDLRRYEFALTGDRPYDPIQEEKFEALLSEINNARLEFVIHEATTSASISR